jgi:RHS repeat-associated protein
MPTRRLLVAGLLIGFVVSLGGATSSRGGTVARAASHHASRRAAANDQGTGGQDLAVGENALVALERAASTGDPVLVADQTSKTTMVLANPDGSLTSQIAPGPVREPDQSSPIGFSPIDLTLTDAVGVGWAPKVSDAAIAFSDGGSPQAASLAVRGETDQSVALSWPDKLPQPTTSGSVATYKQVEPGVDLVAQALPEGFDLQIVLTKQPAPGAEFHLSLTSSKLTASVGESGRLVLDDGQKPIIAADAPLMWDATRDAAGDPARTSPVAITLSKGELVVSPPSDFLADPDVTYPVTIDPAPNLTTTLDTYVDSGSPTSTFNTNTKLRSGNDGSSVVDRSLLQFDTSSLTGAHVLSASLNLHETWSGSCTASSVQVWDLSTSWTSSVTWNTQPTKNQMWASGNTNAGFGASCPDAWVSLSGGGTGSNTLTGLVQNWANTTLTNNGVEVVAADEVNTTADKRFDSYDSGSNQPYLAVNYNSYPSTVVDRWPDNAQYVNTLQPKLHADFLDPDSGTGQVQYEVDNNTSGTNIVTASGTSTSVGGRSYYTVASGLLSDSTTYKWRARGYDGTDYGAWSTFRTFTTDSTAPTSPSVSSSTDPSQSTWYTSQSYTLSFSSSDTGGSGVNGYEILVNQRPDSAACGDVQTSTTYSGTVTSNGVWYAHVAAVDNAGNVGSTTTYQLNIGNGALITPLEGDQTGTTFSLQAVAPTGVTSVKIQYRRSPNDTWSNLPTADVTDAGSGIGSWPVSINSTTHKSDTLVWNALQSLGGSADGGLQIRANFTTGGGGAASAVSLLFDTQPQNQATGGLATTTVGPGSVDLVTGDFSIAAADASVGGLSVDRSFDSLAPSAGSGGVFGPGWSSSLNLGTFVRLYSGADASKGQFATIYAGDDSELDFYLNTAATAYISAPGSDGYALSTSGSGASKSWALTDPQGATTTFTYASTVTSGPDFYPSSFAPATGASESTGYYYALSGSQIRVTQETNALPGVTCTQSGAGTTPGCETFTFTYATSTSGSGNCGTSYGDYNNQLKSVAYTAYDPATAGMKTVTVQNYAYDTTGLLRASCDPRPAGGALATLYSYDGSGRVATLTPPGQNAWSINYDSHGRVTSTVINNDPSGTETTTVVYGVALTKALGGPYDLGTDPSSGAPYPGRWNQQDVPTNATAIFPATEVPSGVPTDYDQATVYYTDANGELVNVAEPVVSQYSTDGLISTAEYDSNGNTIRTLSPANRVTALAAGAKSAQVATTLDTQATYSGDGTEQLETLGPQHLIALPSGSTVLARDHVTNVYGATSSYGQGLVTQTRQGALEVGASSDVEVRTTGYAYTGSHGLDLGLATTLTTDPAGLNIQRVTSYDADGNIIATVMPGNPTGGDAHETDTTYYRAGTGSGVTACDSKPQFAGLVCQTKPAAQPTGSLPDIPTMTYTYDMWGNTLTRTDTSGSSTRSWTYTYDTAGRPSTTAVTGPGSTVATITQAYDSASGLPTTTTDGTNTITHAYDNLGRLKTYTDASSNSTSYTYDAMNRVATLNDGKATQTYTYQTTSDERGLLTTVVDSAAGTFTATYDAASNVSDEHYPNGVDQCTTYDAVGQATDRLYQTGGSCGSSGTTAMIDYTAALSDHGQRLASNGPGSSGNATTESYLYDTAGRLTEADDTVAGQCTTRQYGFDADSNRTQYVSTGPGTGGACQTGTLSTVHSYDAADRLTDSGIAYDSMGRTTTLPAADAGGTQQTFTYYANDRINTLTQGSVTHTATLDPASRMRTWATSADASATQTDHYAGDTDSPAWISENTANTIWTRNILGPDSAVVATQPSSGAITYTLCDLRGSIAATADNTGSLVGTSDYQEFGAPRTGQTARYGWLGGFQRQGDGTTGAILMGARVYSPAVGRFLQSDPIAGGSANAYDYANADPVDGTDLAGMSSCGPGGGLKSDIIQKFPWYGGLFGPSCDYHDACYTWWGTFRAQCDWNFYTRMANQCDHHYPDWNPIRLACKKGASSGYWGVVHFGWQSFMGGIVHGGQIGTCFSRYIYDNLAVFWQQWYKANRSHAAYDACFSAAYKRSDPGTAWILSPYGGWPQW